MSYRHSSYRAMSAAVNKATKPGGPELTRAEMDRVLHWSNRPALPKPEGWGKPKARA
ncbi:hypothetical protein AB0942_33455 [Streptomyces nodosus]|uniref:hypothetical protein n=1 Tax=Streptomyces nodosus TaxID=40318 RepID=UPI00345352E1